MEQNKIITIMGSPDSGKTTTSTKLALELSRRKKNVLLVCCDPFTPVVPFVVPWPENQVSIGELLTAPNLTQKMILDAGIPIKESRYLSLLGYRSGDSLMTYPQITRERVVDFLVCLRYLADYIILDCAAVFEADVLSMVAMELSDFMIKLGTSNLRGISYFESRNVLLSDLRFQPEKQHMYLGNRKPGQEWEAVAEQYGGVEGVFPYLPDLERQYDEMALFESLAGKDASFYLETMQSLADRFNSDFGEDREAAKGIQEKQMDREAEQQEKKVRILKGGQIGERGGKQGFIQLFHRSRGEF